MQELWPRPVVYRNMQDDFELGPRKVEGDGVEDIGCSARAFNCVKQCPLVLHAPLTLGQNVANGCKSRSL